MAVVVLIIELAGLVYMGPPWAPERFSALQWRLRLAAVCFGCQRYVGGSPVDERWQDVNSGGSVGVDAVQVVRVVVRHGVAHGRQLTGMVLVLRIGEELQLGDSHVFQCRQLCELAGVQRPLNT